MDCYPPQMGYENEGLRLHSQACNCETRTASNLEVSRRKSSGLFKKYWPAGAAQITTRRELDVSRL